MADGKKTLENLLEITIRDNGCGMTAEELKDNLLLKVVSVLQDPVTTTDELIPSGETSSYL